MSSWTAASSDCSRPVNIYVHVKTADLYRPNARLTPERQGYQVLTPFGKLGYSQILRRRLPPGRVIRPVGQPGATPPERSRHEEAVSHSRWPSPTEVFGATAPPVGRHPRGHAGRAPAAGRRLGLEGTRGDVGRGSGCRLWSPVCAPARARCVSGRAFAEPGRNWAAARSRSDDRGSGATARSWPCPRSRRSRTRARSTAASSNRCSSA